MAICPRPLAWLDAELSAVQSVDFEVSWGENQSICLDVQGVGSQPSRSEAWLCFTGGLQSPVREIQCHWKGHGEMESFPVLALLSGYREPGG